MIGRLAYGLLFVGVWPAYLALLAQLVEVPVAAVHAPAVGWPLSLVGAATLGAGVLALWSRGGGLPMNAYPPPRLVTSGVYAVVPHPIYTGAALLLAGTALVTGSATLLLVGLPVQVAGSLALVLGHERLRLLARFGRVPEPLLGPRRLLGPLARTLRLTRLWRGVLDGAQRLANSWAARHVGGVRIINHALWSGLAGGVGAALVVLVAGARHTGLVAVLMVAGAGGAALAGQVLVGTTGRLSRPFGYFGGLVGIALVGGFASLIVPDAAVALAAFALVAPVTQAIGRLRCLVQGCCHGAPAPAASGIVVTNPHSRVAAAGLAGRPIYPTQLYSILGNLALAPALAALWWAHAPLALVMGGYLVGAGATRFVEEAYRGEPRTAVWRGLRSYQWFALAMVIAGLGVLLVPTPPCPDRSPGDWPWALGIGAVFLVFCGAALSVDRPGSSARFSRLSG